MLVAAALGGCGGDEEAPTTTSDVTDTTVVAALGDSITAGNPGGLRGRYEYWVERELDGVGMRNCGVFGERTDQIALRLDACADGADALIIQGGTNDVAQGRPVAHTAGDLHAMVARGTELGLDVYLANVLPWNYGHPAADATIAALNSEIDAIGRDEGVPVINFHDALEDPNVPGTMPPELTTDGAHPSVAGHRLLGELVARELGR